MWPMKLSLLTAALAGPAAALLVAPNSPCSRNCGNVLSNTTGTDITCVDSSYSTSAGTVFETCIGCELTSNYSTTTSEGTTETDLQWLLYNLRYTVSYCVFGYPDNPNVEDNPCITSFACGPLKDAFEYGNLTHNTSAYDYCQSWIEDDLSRCTDCLAATGNTVFLRNYAVILEAACSQKPAVGATLSIEGTPFSSVRVNATTPTPSSHFTYSVDKGPVSLGGKVGIAIGALVFLLSLAGFIIVCIGRRRRRAYLKSIASRYGARPNWPPQTAGVPSHDMFETPLSQKPLRGWDNSPASAATDRFENVPYPPYFSPYNSQYNSPVSAVDGQTRAWPTATSPLDALAAAQPGSGSGSDPAADPGVGSSKAPYVWSAPTQGAERSAHENDLVQVGLALGSTDPCLHNKNSDVSVNAPREGEQAPAGFQSTVVFGTSPSSGTVLDRQKGKGRSDSDESYELREIDSNGSAVTPQANAQTPVLQHPGYGRGIYYPRPPSPSPYDLTEDDARPGHTV